MKRLILVLVGMFCSAAPGFPGEIDSALHVDEVGVYYKHDGRWIQMMPEVINWKTGGVVKSISTLGIVRTDVNGRIQNGQASVHLHADTDLLVYCLDGTEITEYQLIRFRTHSDSREFRTVTGGIFHRSGGPQRDLVLFDAQHVGHRMYVLKTSGLPSGEYGLLAPGASMTDSAGTQLGKAYTFFVTSDDTIQNQAADSRPQKDSFADDRPTWKKVLF